MPSGSHMPVERKKCNVVSTEGSGPANPASKPKAPHKAEHPNTGAEIWAECRVFGGVFAVLCVKTSDAYLGMAGPVNI